MNIIRRTVASKLVAFSIAEDRTMHSTELMRVIDCVVSKTNLCEENQAVIAAAKRPKIHLKSADIRLNIIIEELLVGFHDFDYLSSGVNVAEMTKAEHKINLPGC